MKRIILALLVSVVLIGISGADIRREGNAADIPALPKKHCVGYTIIEFGKGIDCHGDTVKLVKVNGGQMLSRSI
jgi:hypothetical protein